jgi:hypothetical protein
MSVFQFSTGSSMPPTFCQLRPSKISELKVSAGIDILALAIITSSLPKSFKNGSNLVPELFVILNSTFV